MSRRPLIVLLGLVLLVVAGAALFVELRPARFDGTAYDPPMPAPDFALTEHTGRTIRLADLRGRPALLFFGYTHCPDVCPLTLARLRRTLDGLGTGPDEIRILLVTVDPARDTPEVLARYVERFGPGVSGVTGSPDALAALARGFGVHSQAGPEGSAHAMMHTSAVFGLDSAGEIRVLIHATDPDADVEGDLGELLRL